MRQRSFFVLIMLLVTLALGACGGTEMAADEVQPQLRIGNVLYPPYTYYDINGNFTGIDVELAREACRRLGYQPVFTGVGLNEWEAMLADGSLDCAWSCLTMEERKDDYLWAGPYLYTNRVVIVPADSNIFTLSDLENKRIAVQANSSTEEILLNGTNPVLPKTNEILAFRTVGEVFTALRKGYADAIVGHESALAIYTSDYPDQYRSLHMSINSSEMGVAFSKDADAGLVDALTDVLREMAEDGTTGKIVESYGLDAGKNVYGGVDK